MTENFLKNTTKLVLQFLEFKCIFYDLYKLGLCCCGTADSPRAADSPPGMNVCSRVFRWDKHWRRQIVRGNDGSSGKTTNNSCANMLGSIPGASELRIKCGLFLWLSSDVGKLLQVLDVPCMGCGELDHLHGGGGHGWR